MEISVSGFDVSPSGSPKAVMVHLFATNNLAIEPNYAMAHVDLESLNLVLTYSYQSSSGKEEARVKLNPVVSLTLTPNFNTTFSVSAENLPIQAGALAMLTIGGNYTWQLHTTVNGSNGTTYRTIYGSGSIEAYSQEVNP